MKQIILFFLLAFVFQGSFAQKINASNVPDSIRKDFDNRFPAAKNIKWKKVESLYFAKCMIKGKGIDVTYESAGNWVETLKEIKVSEVPQEVVTGILNLYTGAKIKAAAMIEQSTKEHLYMIQLRFRGKMIEITVDAKGNQV